MYKILIIAFKIQIQPQIWIRLVILDFDTTILHSTSLSKMTTSEEIIIRLNTIEEALHEIRNGKVIIVVDDEDRENEGDFICAAALRQNCQLYGYQWQED